MIVLAVVNIKNSINMKEVLKNLIFLGQFGGVDINKLYIVDTNFAYLLLKYI